MTSKIKTSLITASLIVAASAFTGCGGGSDDTPIVAADTTKTVADGYLVSLTDKVIANCNSGSHESLTTVGSEGKITFKGVTLTSDCNITVPATAVINAGDTNKTLGFPLKASGDMTVVSQLTTLVVDKQAKGENVADLKALVKDFNPVTAASTVGATTTTTTDKLKVQKLMVLGEVLKTAMKSATSANVADINVSTFTNTTTSIIDLDVNSTLPDAIKYDAIMSAAITSKASAITSVVQILDKIDTSKIDLNELVVTMSDGDANLTTALTSSAKTGVVITDTNLSNIVKSGQDINTSVVTSINAAVTTANTAVTYTPAKISTGTKVKLGENEYTLNGTTFTAKIANGSNVSSFYNITLPKVTTTKGFTETDVNVTVTVVNNADSRDTLIATLNGLKLSTDDNSTVKTTITSGSTTGSADLNVTSSDGSLEEEKTGTRTYSGTTLINTDFAFDLGAIIKTYNNQTDVARYENKINTYLKQGKTYTVTITITSANTDSIFDFSTITGTVTVE